jgi:hypothetical protein
MARHKLTDVPGVGTVSAAELKKAGIRDIEILADASVETIASVHGFAASRAAAVKKAAQALARSARPAVKESTSAEPTGAGKSAKKKDKKKKKKKKKDEKNKRKKKDKKGKGKRGKKGKKGDKKKKKPGNKKKNNKK